ncbi:MAG: ComEC/Rec2 family competence protein [Treponema sp.]|nr:ComEC/Rec2 family competence protein [Treponema sp.]
MVNSRTFTPVVFAAAGAACGFYALSPLYHNNIISLAGFYLIMLAPLSALCFVHVLSSSVLAVSRTARIAMRRVLAFTAGLALGIGAGGNAVQQFHLGLAPEKIIGIAGVMAEDPHTINGGRVIAALKLRNVFAESGLRTGASGEITVVFPELNAGQLKGYGRGSTVFCNGVIRNGASGTLFRADSVHITKNAPPLENFRTNVRNSLIRRFGSGAWGQLSLALLIGVRDTLDSGITGLYRDAGCAYLLALSGMHLAIIASLIAFLLKKPLGMKAAAIAGALIIAAYCLLVGPLPSLTRSAFMYLLGVLAVTGFMKRDAISLLSMAFLLQITFMPGSGNTISFILSYLALIGIVYVGGAVNYIFRGKIPALILNSLSMSAGAFLLTAGVSVYYFSVLRPIGIATSLILVPLITVYMIGSIVWLALDIIAPVLSGFTSPVLSFIYNLMEKIVRTAAHAPPFPPAGFWFILAGSLFISVFLVWFAAWRKTVRNRIPAFT